MKSILWGIWIVCIAWSLSWCTGDSPTTMRQLKCYGREEILPLEISEIENATKDRIVKACWWYHVIDGMHPSDWGTRLHATVISTQSWNLFSLVRKIDSLLIPKPSVPAEPERPSSVSKYSVRP